MFDTDVDRPEALFDEHSPFDTKLVSSILGLLLVLLLSSLVLHVVARVLRVEVADESCRRRPWLPTHWREPIEDGEQIEFTAGDGTTLNGTWLPRTIETCKGVVVYSHELNGDRWNALSYLEHLRCEGFDVFTFDYRNHGRGNSRCRWESDFEVSEPDVADLRAALHAAASRSEESDPKVAIVGVGKGAAVALCVAGSEPLVRTLVLDSVQPLGGPRSEAIGSSWSIWWRRLGCMLQSKSKPAFDPVAIAPQIHVPVLLIHGRNDVHSSLDAVRTLASQIGGQCQLWVVPGARHAEAVCVDRAAYRRRIARFLAHSLHIKPPAVQPVQTQAEAAVQNRRVSSAPAQS